MKKTIKSFTAFLLLLTLVTTIKPVLPIPQPEDNEPGITVQGDEDADDKSSNILPH